MSRLLVHWIITALAVWITSMAVPGFYVSGPIAALIAAVAIGFANATIGWILKIITFPITLVTFGIFWLVINAVIIELAAAFVPGFYVRSFGAAFLGAIVLSILNMLLKWLIIPKHTH
jgi:putative membrane protein